MAPFKLFWLPPRFRRRARRSRMATLVTLGLTVLLLLSPFYIIYKPPNLMIKYFAYRYPRVLWYVPLPSDNKIVALSIDDAPSSYTPEIAALLKANDAAATFFVIGSQVASRAESLSDLVKEGNELGNHAMYDEPAKSLSDQDLGRQVKSVEQSIGDAYDIVGKERPDHRWFRPGSGFFSERLLNVVEGMGLRTVLGSVYPHDPQISYAWVNARHILSMVRPGSIIICHDRRSWTLPMLEKVIPALKSKGYSIVTISQLVAEGERAAKKQPIKADSKNDGAQGPAKQKADHDD